MEKKQEKKPNSIKLLIVDDISSARSGLKALLESYPDQIKRLEISEASNGQEAVQFCKVSKPDLIIMDIKMPVMDGIMATQVIKNRWPEIRIIAFTMYTMHQKQILEAGADDFLIKGCSTEILFETIFK